MPIGWPLAYPPLRLVHFVFPRPFSGAAIVSSTVHGGVKRRGATLAIAAHKFGRLLTMMVRGRSGGLSARRPVSNLSAYSAAAMSSGNTVPIGSSNFLV